MNSTVQYKLLNLEATPPEGVWSKIAVDLNDAASGFQFPKKLQEMAVAPPVAAWANIAAGLESSTPVAVKLYAAEVVPPIAVWNNIQHSLDVAKEAAVPEHRRLSPFLKYAAAAAVISFLAFGAQQLWKPGNNETAKTSGKPVIPAIEAIEHANAGLDAAGEENNTIVVNNDNPDARNDAALEASKKTYAKLDITPSKKADIASAFRFSTYVDEVDPGQHGSEGYHEAVSPEEARADRYILLMTPDGHFIRMSKKLSNLVCCVSGEEQDKNCKTQVDKWRKQLACSDVSHPGNFMDILSLVNSLQDN